MNYDVGTRLLVQRIKDATITELKVVEASELCLKLEFITSEFAGEYVWIPKSQNDFVDGWKLYEVINTKNPF